MGKRCFYEQDPTLDPEWGNAAEVFPFYFARVVKLVKALHSQATHSLLALAVASTTPECLPCGMQGGESLLWVRDPPRVLCAYSRME